MEEVHMHIRLPATRRHLLIRVVTLAVVLGALISFTAQAADAYTAARDRPALSTVVRQVSLDSDRRGLAGRTDARLVNPWGVAFLERDPIWIADNGSGLATEYNGHGVATGRVITIPSPPGSAKGSTAAPTGVVFNGGRDFVVKQGRASASSLLLFATEDGTIAGWSPRVNATHAILVVNNSRLPSASAGAVYKGLALGRLGGRSFLYVANFRAARIDVFDATFRAAHLSGTFHDGRIPAGYAPFNIANQGGELYVTYALQNGEKHDDLAGAGHGFVDVYNTSGHLLRRLVARGRLDSPWGMVVAPRGFGAGGGDLLVGNFGNGRITIYDRHSGAFRGQLTDTTGHALVNSGLWGLTFGDGSRAAPRTTLYFTAGINDEQHGLFGDLAAR
jgi:uncharacterized protein (TIGR03118 family)